MDGSTAPDGNYLEDLKRDYGHAVQSFERREAQSQQQLSFAEQKLRDEQAKTSQAQSEISQLREFVSSCSRQLDELTQARNQLQQQLSQTEQTAHQLQGQLTEAAEREAALNSRVDDLEQEAELKLAKDSSDCVVSLAFASADGRRNYQQAVQAFLSPLEQKYIMRHEVLEAPQACRFLIWAIVTAGRLPDELTEFEAYRRASGMNFTTRSTLQQIGPSASRLICRLRLIRCRLPTCCRACHSPREN